MADADCTGGPLLLNISQDGQLVESIDLSRAETRPVAIPLENCTAGTVDLQLVNEAPPIFPAASGWNNPAAKSNKKA